MRKLAIAMALASTTLATPALARDGSFYAAINGGIMVLEDSNIDLVDLSDESISIDDFAILKSKPGFDVDLTAGYDFGMIRVEGEIGYKHAGLDEVELRNAIPVTGAFGANFDADGNSRSLSFMVNALLDVGDEDSWSGYVGPGIGIADVRMHVDDIDGIDLDDLDLDNSIRDSRLAWQVVAGVRTAITPNIDVGDK